MSKAKRPKHKWSMDFMSAKVLEGRWFLVLALIDQFTRDSWRQSPTGLEFRKNSMKSCIFGGGGGN